MHERDDSSPPDAELGHETRDISTRVVVMFGGALVAGAILVHVAIWLVYMYLGGLADRAYPREFPLASVGAPAQPPAPRLQTQPREDLKRMRAEEQKILSGYGWVDASGGVVYVPIEQAMKTTLEQGLPARPGAPPFTPEVRPERSSSGRTVALSGR
jgi:hypothetical protein